MSVENDPNYSPVIISPRKRKIGLLKLSDFELEKNGNKEEEKRIKKIIKNIYSPVIKCKFFSLAEFELLKNQNSQKKNNNNSGIKNTNSIQVQSSPSVIVIDDESEPNSSEIESQDIFNFSESLNLELTDEMEISGYVDQTSQEDLDDQEDHQDAIVIQNETPEVVIIDESNNNSNPSTESQNLDSNIIENMKRVVIKVPELIGISDFINQYSSRNFQNSAQRIQEDEQPIQAEIESAIVSAANNVAPSVPSTVALPSPPPPSPPSENNNHPELENNITITIEDDEDENLHDSSTSDDSMHGKSKRVEKDGNSEGENIPLIKKSKINHQDISFANQDSFKNGTFDTIISINTWRMCASSKILRKESTVFAETMDSKTDLQKLIVNHINYEDMTYLLETLNDINKVVVTLENVKKLSSFSKKFGISKLKEACKNFIKNMVQTDADFALNLLQNSSNINKNLLSKENNSPEELNELKSECIESLCKNLNQNIFTKLSEIFDSFDIIKEILQSDEMNVSEEELFNFFVSCSLKSSSKTNSSLFVENGENFLKNIKLGSMDSKFPFEIIQKNTLSTSNLLLPQLLEFIRFPTMSIEYLNEKCSKLVADGLMDSDDFHAIKEDAIHRFSGNPYWQPRSRFGCKPRSMIPHYLPSRVLLKINKTLCVFIYFGQKSLIDILFSQNPSNGKFKEEIETFRFGFWKSIKIDENAINIPCVPLPEEEFSYYVYARKYKNKKVEICMAPKKNQAQQQDDQRLLGFISGFVGLPETGIYEYEFNF